MENIIAEQKRLKSKYFSAVDSAENKEQSVSILNEWFNVSSNLYAKTNMGDQIEDLKREYSIKLNEITRGNVVQNKTGMGQYNSWITSPTFITLALSIGVIGIVFWLNRKGILK